MRIFVVISMLLLVLFVSGCQDNNANILKPQIDTIVTGKSGDMYINIYRLESGDIVVVLDQHTERGLERALITGRDVTRLKLSSFILD